MAQSQPSVSFSVCDLCDRFRDGTDSRFRVLTPEFSSFGGSASFFGKVTTVKCYEDNSKVKELLATPGEGRVLLVDGCGSLRRALVGGQIAESAAKNNWAGVVVDGCVRDAAELRNAKVGIVARALCPMPTVRANQGQVDVAVTVFGGTRVEPGEWLYADPDGIVVYNANLIQ